MATRKKTATPAADTLESAKAAEIAKAEEFGQRLDGLSSQLQQAAEGAQTVEGQKAIVEIRSRILTPENAAQLRELGRKQREVRATKAEAKAPVDVERKTA